MLEYLSAYFEVFTKKHICPNLGNRILYYHQQLQQQQIGQPIIRDYIF
jgi:hypothetical protein